MHVTAVSRVYGMFDNRDFFEECVLSEPVEGDILAYEVFATEQHI